MKKVLLSLILTALSVQFVPTAQAHGDFQIGSNDLVEGSSFPRANLFNGMGCTGGTSGADAEKVFANDFSSANYGGPCLLVRRLTLTHSLFMR